METTELIHIIAQGEDSKHQFKENINTKDKASLEGEMVAFSNSGGGKIFIGVEDKNWSVQYLLENNRKKE